MGYLLETAISAFFLVAILAISFMFFWRARSVERRLNLLMKAALANTRDLRNCSEVIENGFHTLSRAENHQRALLASLNSQMANLGAMLETGSRPQGRSRGEGKEGEGSSPATAERAARPVALGTAEATLAALETLTAQAAVRSVMQDGSNARVSAVARPGMATGNKEVVVVGYQSVSNKSSERVPTAARNAGLQRKIKTIEALFRKVDLPVIAGASRPADAQASNPVSPPRFADLVSMKRRVANG